MDLAVHGQSSAGDGEPSGVLVVDPPLDLRAPALARQQVAGHGAAHAPDRAREAVDEAVPLVSELVTNALRYGAAPLTLRVRVRSNGIHVGVSDASRHLPVVAPSPLTGVPRRDEAC